MILPTRIKNMQDMTCQWIRTPHRPFISHQHRGRRSPQCFLLFTLHMTIQEYKLNLVSLHQYKELPPPLPASPRVSRKPPLPTSSTSSKSSNEQSSVSMAIHWPSPCSIEKYKRGENQVSKCDLERLEWKQKLYMTSTWNIFSIQKELFITCYCQCPSNTLAITSVYKDITHMLNNIFGLCNFQMMDGLMMSLYVLLLYKEAKRS